MTAYALPPLPDNGQPYEIVPMLTPSQAVDAFLADMDGKSKSRTGRTSRDYRRLLYKFCDQLGPHMDVTEITAAHVRRFFSDYQHLAPNTYSTYDACFRSFFKWLGRRIKVNPMEEIPKPTRPDPLDLDVVIVEKQDVARMLAAADTWPEKLALNVAVYTGARRAALSSLRLRDYNPMTRKIKFQEKLSKTIEKPVPIELQALIQDAIDAGVYKSADDYLIPSPGKPVKKERNDRVIWDIITGLAKDVGVKAHVHALRAAFATFYLETHHNDTVALKELMGHSHLNVTEVYLRKLDRQQAMERVRDLSWSTVAQPDYGTLSSFPQNAGNSFGESRAMGAGGFEPPSSEPGSTMRPGRLPGP